MSLYATLLLKILPLYGLMLAGYALGRLTRISARLVSTVIIWVLVPAVILESVLRADLQRLLLIPMAVVAYAYLMSRLGGKLSGHLRAGVNTHLLACAYGYSNVGWFGIPAVYSVFGSAALPIIVSAYIGNSFFGATYGFYLVARTRFTLRNALLQPFKAAPTYAFMLAALGNALGWQLPGPLENICAAAKWILSVFGMLTVGLALSQTNLRRIPVRKLVRALIPRYLLGPAVISVLLVLEALTLGWLDDLARRVLFFTSVFPVAAHLVSLSTYFESEKENASFLVLISTLLSFIIVPGVALLLA